MEFSKSKSQKWLKNGDLHVIGSHFYAHYPIIFILLFEQYGEVLQSARIQEKKTIAMDLT